jgi:aquaporin related protein
MWIIGAVGWFRAILLAIVQILAGIAAAGLVECIFPGDLNVRTTLNEKTSVGQGFVIEMLLTAQLVFAIFMLAAEKHAGTFIAPVGIGLALFIAELTGERNPYFYVLRANPCRCFLDWWKPQPC